MRGTLEQPCRGDPSGISTTGRRKDGLPEQAMDGAARLKSTCFPGVIEDGVWTIDVSPSMARDAFPSPSVQVISPTIDYDSGLFDRVRARVRTIHHSPTVGSFSLTWTNEHNRTDPGQDPEKRSSSRFFLSGQSGFAYTTEWQEVEFTLPESDGEIAPHDAKVWEGLLQDIRLSFRLDWGEHGSVPAGGRASRMV